MLLLLVVAVFSLPTLAKFETCGIQVGTKEIVHEAIKKELWEHPKRIYAMKCRGASVGQQECTAYKSTSDRVKSAAPAAESLAAAEELTSIVGAANQARVQRLDAFIPFIDKQVLAGKLCYGEVWLNGKRGNRLDRVYGPGDAFRKEIAKGRANVLSAAVPETFKISKSDDDEPETFKSLKPDDDEPETFKSLKPDDVVKEVFQTLSRRVQKGRLNIVIFPEFFFNRIYRTDGQRVLDNEMVARILKEYRAAFGGKWNVLCSLSLFHLFDSTEALPWLQNWEKPAWLGKQDAWWTFSGWEEDQAGAFKAVFGSRERRLANYQLFYVVGRSLPFIGRVAMLTRWSWVQRRLI